MQRIYFYRTTPESEFTDALAQNAVENERLVLPAGFGGRVLLRSLSVVSAENLSWEINLWETASFGGALIGADEFLGRWQFSSSDGLQIAGAGLYRYYIDGLLVSFVTKVVEQQTRLYASLVNRSAGAKSAGAAGAIRIGFGLELI